MVEFNNCVELFFKEESWAKIVKKNELKSTLLALIGKYQEIITNFLKYQGPVNIEDLQNRYNIEKDKIKFTLQKLIGDQHEYYTKLFVHPPIMIFSGDPRQDLVNDLQQDRHNCEWVLSMLHDDMFPLNNAPSSPSSRDLSNKVFVVYGRDNEMKATVPAMLRQLHLIPVLLEDQPSQSNTIIEKFEHNSDVDYVIILLSPDDQVSSRNENPNSVKYRARQNVILEMGYFIGKLGRKNCAILFRPDQNFEFPSDIQGLVYIKYDSEGSWKYKLIKEMKSIGFDISADAV